MVDAHNHRLSTSKRFNRPYSTILSDLSLVWLGPEYITVPSPTLRRHTKASPLQFPGHATTVVYRNYTLCWHTYDRM